MPRRGWIATAMLAALCFAGITTLVSQTGYSGAPEREGRDRRASLDPGEGSGDTLGDLAEHGLRAGAEIQSSVAAEEAPSRGKILRLR